MTRAAGKKLLNLPSRSTAAGNMRSVKIVKPACQVPVSVQGRTEYTTGPCQQAVKQDPVLEFCWFKTCTHGPEQDSEGNPIPPELRPYYSLDIRMERTPVVQEGVIVEWKEKPLYDVTLRVDEAVKHPMVDSGNQLKRELERGAKLVSEFGIAPFCEHLGCYRQDIRKFLNGMFCSENHARMVKARETGVLLPLAGFDATWQRQTSTEKRAEVLAQIEV